MKQLFAGLALLLSCVATQSAYAAGTLQPVGAGTQPIQIVDHDVRITIDNGFARVQVDQKFSNPNDQVLEGLYSFPLPVSASLSEMSITAGETRLNGEVVPKDQAKAAYEEEKSQGNDAGLATKENFQRFEFRVFPLPPRQPVAVSFVYYQPLEIDTGFARLVYPLEEGGTDEVAKAFWTRNEKVENSFSVDVTIKSAWPIDAVRSPGLEQVAQVTHPDEHTWKLRADRPGGTLAKDFVVYYRLADNLPGRVEVVPFRDGGKPGTFMMVVTPGVDLQPIQQGADYVFVLDVSGSMQTKLPTLARGMEEALRHLDARDRFRIVTFSDNAGELIDWTPATADNVTAAVAQIDQLHSQSSTNLYAGLKEGLSDLDADRVTSLVLVTDGVTNTGVVDPKEFAALLAKYDIRIFGFVMGNSANWPLMRLITDATGGFYAGISNDDDITGQLLLARSKIKSEALHNVEVDISGGGVHDISGKVGRKIYRGQQLVLFGRYDKPGKAKLRIKANLSGKDEVYATEFELPEVARENPELERLWALSSVEDAERAAMLGLLDPSESAARIRNLGVDYQLVTDETSMLVLRDDRFQQRGIERRNLLRLTREHEAQAQRAQAPVQSYRVDQAAPAFKHNAPTLAGGNAHDSGGARSSGGSGALGLPLLGLLGLGAAAQAVRRRQGRQAGRSS